MNYVDEFKVYLLNNNRKKLTVKKHLFWLSKVTQECPKWSVEELGLFLAKKKEQGCKTSHINVIIETIRCYAGFKGYGEILDGIKYLKNNDDYERATMSDEEIEAFLTLKRPKGTWPKMWSLYTMIFKILFFTGLRPREACSLQVDDIDFGLGTIRIRPEFAKTKGKVPIPENILQDLKDYISSTRGKLLFPSPRGGTSSDGFMLVGCVDTHFQKRIRILGIKRANLTPHSARHTYGTRLGEQDVNLYTIKNLMRHSKITTTETYLHMSLKTMKEGQMKLPLIQKHINPLAILESFEAVVKKYNLLLDPRFSEEFKDQIHSAIYKELKRLNNAIRTSV